MNWAQAARSAYLWGKPMYPPANRRRRPPAARPAASPTSLCLECSTRGEQCIEPCRPLLVSLALTRKHRVSSLVPVATTGTLRMTVPARQKFLKSCEVAHGEAMKRFIAAPPGAWQTGRESFRICAVQERWLVMRKGGGQGVPMLLWVHILVRWFMVLSPWRGKRSPWFTLLWRSLSLLGA